MKRVIIESPYAGTKKQMQKNIEYAHACMRDSLSRGEAPFASHILYGYILNDQKEDERRTGMEAGFEWGRLAELVAVYVDNGISLGMEEGIIRYNRLGVPKEIRSLVSDPLIQELKK